MPRSEKPPAGQKPGMKQGCTAIASTYIYIALGVGSRRRQGQGNKIFSRMFGDGRQVLSYSFAPVNTLLL